jgi:hypothetical protein
VAQTLLAGEAWKFDPEQVDPEQVDPEQIDYKKLVL